MLEPPALASVVPLIRIQLLTLAGLFFQASCLHYLPRDNYNAYRDRIILGLKLYFFIITLPVVLKVDLWDLYSRNGGASRQVHEMELIAS